MIKEERVKYIDLRGTPCPVNFIRCKLALEKISPSEFLKVDLDKGEPQETITLGLQSIGYKVELISEELSWVSLMVTALAN